MVKLLTGGKGAGKTKKLIEMANTEVKTTDGHIVFIDDDNRHIYDLHYDIRFVPTREYPLANYREFIGFVCGILSQDSDIKEIYVDGLHNIIETFEMEHTKKLCDRLHELSKDLGVDFIMSLHYETNELTEELRKLAI